MWLSAFALSVVASFSSIVTPQLSEKLYYLNLPESIRREGVVGKFTTLSSQRTRVFFHFVNKTSKEQKFILHFNKDVRDFKIGYGISIHPGIAGFMGVTDFALRTPVNKIGGVNLAVNLKNGVTISGVCEGQTLENTTVLAYFGQNKNSIEYKISESNNVLEIIDVNLSKKQSKILRIGTKRPGMIDGDYGTTFRFNIKPILLKPSRLIISASPRGGTASLFFLKDKEIKKMLSVSAKRKILIYDFNVNPGENITIDTMLPGGYAYPLEISFSIL